MDLRIRRGTLPKDIKNINLSVERVEYLKFKYYMKGIGRSVTGVVDDYMKIINSIIEEGSGDVVHIKITKEDIIQARGRMNKAVNLTKEVFGGENGKAN